LNCELNVNKKLYNVLIQAKKLAQWYRWKYKHIEATKSGSAPTANRYMAVLAANIKKAP
jgi:hypothetical protein